MFNGVALLRVRDTHHGSGRPPLPWNNESSTVSSTMEFLMTMMPPAMLLSRLDDCTTTEPSTIQMPTAHVVGGRGG